MRYIFDATQNCYHTVSCFFKKIVNLILVQTKVSFLNSIQTN
jgi:hypothetical protein